MSMPHETNIVSKAMFPLREKLLRLLAKMEESPSEKSAYFADIDQVPEEFLDSLDVHVHSRLLFHFGMINVTGSPTKVHEKTRSAIGDAFSRAISPVMGDCTTYESVINIVNSFACGRVVAKAADVLIVRKSDGRPLLAGEVAYSHESLEELVLECVHFLTEYTTPWYSVGVKIMYTGPFLAYLFVLERLESNSPEEEDLFADILGDFEDKVTANSKNLCKQRFSLDEEKFQNYYDNKDEIDSLLSSMGVKLIYFDILTPDNYYRDRAIYLPRYDCLVTVLKEDIALIVHYHNITQSRRQRTRER